MKNGFIPEKSLQKFHTNYTVVDTGYKTPCWLWNRALTEKGYGQFWFKEFGKGKSKNHRAHRAAYIHYVNPNLDPKLDLDHQCDIEACANPWHVQECTTQVNNARKWLVIHALLEHNRSEYTVMSSQDL